MANTVLMKAKESTRDGKGRSKKWRTMLGFSEPSECEYLRETLDLSYMSIVGQQPIGEKLFEEFCETEDLLDICWEFIRRLEDYRTLPNEKLKDYAQQIFEEFFTPRAKPEPPLPTADTDTIETLNNNTADAYPGPAKSKPSLVEVSYLLFSELLLPYISSESICCSGEIILEE